VVVVRGAVDEFSWSLTGAQVTVVGQPAGAVPAAILAGTNPGLALNGGDLYVRNVSVSCVPDFSDRGIVAQSGAVLRLNRVTVKNCAKGGLFVDGAGFDVRQSTFTGNGPGDIMGFPWGGIRVQGSPAGGPPRLESVTIKDNKGPGLSCSAAVMGTGVLVTGNSMPEVSPTCGVASCGAAGPTCGGQ
jgi:hypothetical protein